MVLLQKNGHHNTQLKGEKFDHCESDCSTAEKQIVPLCQE